MNALPALINAGTGFASLTSLTGVLFTIGVTAIAAVSVGARSPQRRRDARETLAILLRCSRKR